MERIGEQIPVDVITGMKGAGKTTLINALLEGPYRDSRVAVFTNEMGDVPYGEACRVHPVLGGCICCTAQAELIAGIRRVLQEEEPERIVIEMSGKGAIQDLLQIFAYLPSCALHQLIYVLDIRKWRALAAVLGDFPQQIRSAPILLFSRWKEVSPELRTASAAQMRQWNPEILLLTDPAQAGREASGEADPSGGEMSPRFRKIRRPSSGRRP